MAPTLVILDNLETIPENGLRELLDSAVDWSTTGDSKVLLTSRKPDFNHGDYRIAGTRIHRRISLEGLGSADHPNDALDWFAELSKLPYVDENNTIPPPGREELVSLFDRVSFHPLSIAVLVQQLRTRTAQTLSKRLETILSDDAVSGIAEDGTPRSLIASLQLSLEELNDAERHAVRRLGVFQGGAFEENLLFIMEAGKSDAERAQLNVQFAALEDRDPRVNLNSIGETLPNDTQFPTDVLTQLTGIPEFEQQVEQLRAQLADNLWPGLRRKLEAAALINAEMVRGFVRPFLRFHPTLAPLLWAGLDGEEKTNLTLAHCQRYHRLVEYLYQEDTKNPHQIRAAAHQELPNLLQAAHHSLDAGDPDAVEFAVLVVRFLNILGRTREAASLALRAEQACGKKGSRSWYQAEINRGVQRLESHHVQEATEIFTEIMTTLGDDPSYELTLVLGHLSRCYQYGGRFILAENHCRRGITVAQKIRQDESVKQQQALLHTNLADVLVDRGMFNEAHEQYKNAQKIQQELNDLRGIGVTLSQLGSLAIQEGHLDYAITLLDEALQLFQDLNEPAMVAVSHQKLGNSYSAGMRFKKAEKHYRDSASLMEKTGDLVGAATIWIEIAEIRQTFGKLEAAEMWSRKAIDVLRNEPYFLMSARSNLANLLKNQPGRLAEARQLAEEALATGKTMDAGAAKIWKLYDSLANIAYLESAPSRVAEYRRLAREAKWNFAGTAHEMKREWHVIFGTWLAAQEPREAEKFSIDLSEMEEQGGTKLVAAIRKILSGQRNADELCLDLDLQNSMIIETILQALEDSSTLEALMPEVDVPA